MSIFVAAFILINALKSYKKIVDLFLEKIPEGIDIEKIKEHLLEIENVKDIHHIHIWSIDGSNNYATMHIVTDVDDTKCLKCEIKSELKEHGIVHVTIEFEKEDEKCDETECHVEHEGHAHHHHHHH
jgi:cobalt-zinc-cadmium efflux system protein